MQNAFMAKFQNKFIWLAAPLLAFFMFLTLLIPAFAATPPEDADRLGQYLDKAVASATAGSLPVAQAHYKNYEKAWLELEDGIRDSSKTAYREIEEKMLLVGEAFALKTDNSTRPANIVTSLTALRTCIQTYGAGGFPLNAAGGAASTTTIGDVLQLLNAAQSKFKLNDFSGAAQQVKEFQERWLDVEGVVKTRSAKDYSDTENDMALAYTLLTQKSPDAEAVLTRMTQRLQPYENAANYGILDAMIILLREGLEALLVVVALLTFLKKAGQGNKQGYVWGGVVAGLVASVALGITIQLFFSSIINGTNRELIEGVTGLVAAVMLIYVSYWMHGKSSAVAWQKYLKSKTSQAISSGSLIGLGVLSFLAIFREGAETVLFYIGIGSSITTTDLLVGLVIGTVLLLVLGVLMVVLGLRIPIAPFFKVASILVFYICFKFVGTGIHGLQVAGVLPATSASYLPSNDFLGIFPTYETTIPQIVLLGLAVGVVIFSGRKEKAPPAAPNKPEPVLVGK